MRNTRIRLTLATPDLAPGWSADAVAEVDFFGGFNGTGAFSDAQPQPRLRIAHVDLQHGSTTLRVGQAASLLLGLVPVSVSHLAFPVGLGSAGVIGWREPGIFVMHRLSAAPDAPQWQLQLAALRGAWSGPGNNLEQQNAGEAAMIPQLEARVDVSRRTERGSWLAYAVAHYDQKDLDGVGQDGDGQLTGTAVQAGGRVVNGPGTLAGNVYRGRAIGQQFAHLVQFGDIRGWGGWAQAGWQFTPQVSGWALIGTDDPADDDVRRAVEHDARLRNVTSSLALRYSIGCYTIASEWLTSRTTWVTGPTTGPAATHAGRQLALSVLYQF